MLVDGGPVGEEGEGVGRRKTVQGNRSRKVSGSRAIKDRLNALKKIKPRDEATIAKAEAELSALIKASREAASKAESIENAVYDLKAVNPHRKAVVDTRTPAELLDLIEEKGREVAEALAVLRSYGT